MAKSISNIFKKHLSDRLADYFEENPFFIIGVSGGPDSMALLYLLHQLQVDCLVVHVNYNKRGKQSDKDQELVEQISFAWGFECCSIQITPDKNQGKNFQNWAREQRYQFFRDLKVAHTADGIITAHHKDDQVETILQKILRGSSPTAWKGMDVWDGQLFRPLLPFSKEKILAFCEAEAVPYRIDKSNLKSDYARNYIRNEFTEKADKLFPGWHKNILSLPGYAESFEDSIRYITDSVSSGIGIDLTAFSELPELIKPAVIKHFLDESGLKGTYSKQQLTDLAEIEYVQTGKSLKIGDFELIRDRNKAKLIKAKKSNQAEISITENDVASGWANDRLSISKQKNIETNADLALDYTKLSWPLTLRTWNEGDSFQPLGMEGNQKISKHLTNRKISTSTREKALVLCGSDSTIYAIIYPELPTNQQWGNISELAKIDYNTNTILTINILL
ncbi:tRNA lysidine(34) synthetase TilS [Gracilimonas sp.]|uniref:tRNA lysidine(34) synthetase TilS n=1 Tax=Gracilimonas sp. TaxID=1974203 RepID=UPI002871BF41|nr:tRNA lysidine(34) synthetase TilS [Gracilimonas sp.]